MKKRKIYLISALLLTSLLFTGCYKNPTVDSGTPLPTEETVTLAPEIKASPTTTTNIESQQLLNLLPKETGHKWIYNGFAEYSHEMTLDSITEDTETGNIVYNINGMVEDLSNGESDRDYSMSIRYIIGEFTITQELSGDMVMDNTFDSIQLVKLPLESGNSWEQEVINKNDGSIVNLRCTIEEVTKNDDKKVYTILYQDTDSEYYEKRIITEGLGVTSFEKLYTTGDDEPFLIRYSLFE
jgi:hypothetical protein